MEFVGGKNSEKVQDFLLGEMVIEAVELEDKNVAFVGGKNFEKVQDKYQPAKD